MDGTGHYAEMQERKARVLAFAPQSHRDRILGRAPMHWPAKTHRITVDCRTGERRVEQVVRPAPAPRLAPPPVVVPVARPNFHDKHIETTKRERVNAIVQACADAWEISTYLLCSPSRTNRTTRPRFAAYYMLKHSAKLSFPHIGKVLGRRDHTSAISGVERAEWLMLNDRDWRARYDIAASQVPA
tara:strand:+ start:335 stop:892 length:558 start_codon:yes stop_codon:yes gene_type:complete